MVECLGRDSSSLVFLYPMAPPAGLLGEAGRVWEEGLCHAPGHATTGFELDPCCPESGSEAGVLRSQERWRGRLRWTGLLRATGLVHQGRKWGGGGKERGNTVTVGRIEQAE